MSAEPGNLGGIRRSLLNKSRFTMINLAKSQFSGLGLDRKQDYSVPS